MKNVGLFNLFGASVFGDGLGAFTDSVLGKFTREQKPDGGLDLPGGDGRPLVVVSKTRSFSGDALEDVINEAVHDAHSLAGDSSVGMDLFQHLVDVNGVRFLPLLLAVLLVTLCDVLHRLSGLLHCLSASLSRRCHGFSMYTGYVRSKNENDTDLRPAFNGFRAAAPIQLPRAPPHHSTMQRSCWSGAAAPQCIKEGGRSKQASVLLVSFVTQVLLLPISKCLDVAKEVARSRESQRPAPTELDSSSP